VKQPRVSNNFIANNDRVQRFARVSHFKQKEGGREQDSGETERECVRGRALRQEKDSVSNKTENKHLIQMCD